MPRPILRPLAVPTLALLLAGCSWSVPADPGLNAARRAPDAFLASGPSGRGAGGRTIAEPGADDPVARRLYVERCGRCHALPSPRRATAARWPAILRTMAPRAGLFGADRERVTRWVVANSR